ncbi:uncharacterized protein LOC127751169 [Frankliniella occidentalis]|uniref:Uncharacterized protein LOC127751169 n=1 Tax=Frankliniella occidentalis TaxID=133901 RepID=A0A9C6XT92_FRAOC|nr:uncharacterized protein LOC127751169 [Frankliniella occidentalis]
MRRLNKNQLFYTFHRIRYLTHEIVTDKFDKASSFISERTVDHGESERVIVTSLAQIHDDKTLSDSSPIQMPKDNFLPSSKNFLKRKLTVSLNEDLDMIQPCMDGPSSPKKPCATKGAPSPFSDEDSCSSGGSQPQDQEEDDDEDTMYQYLKYQFSKINKKLRKMDKKIDAFIDKNGSNKGNKKSSAELCPEEEVREGFVSFGNGIFLKEDEVKKVTEKGDKETLLQAKIGKLLTMCLGNDLRRWCLAQTQSNKEKETIPDIIIERIRSEWLQNTAMISCTPFHFNIILNIEIIFMLLCVPDEIKNGSVESNYRKLLRHESLSKFKGDELTRKLTALRNTAHEQTLALHLDVVRGKISKILHYNETKYDQAEGKEKEAAAKEQE